MSPTLNDIEQQEDDLFRYLCEPPYRVLQNIAKAMAKQQLCVSEDSPFNLPKENTDLEEAGLYRLREQRAAELKQETEEIKHQLELVKGRLAQLNDKENSKEEAKTSEEAETLDQQAQVQTYATREGSSSMNCRPKQVGGNRGVDKSKTRDAELKLRPLTGKADCPNCVCDRRTSVCDQCIRFKPAQIDIAPIIFDSGLSNGSEARRQICKSINYNDDDRPIRPTKDRKLGTVEVVDDVVVPNQVYTISRSLNDKRTKLAQAIEELQTMIERVKERDRRLEEDRKLVQQYKQQWKFGPNIGGPLASPRDRMGINNVNKQSHVRRSYESRLDTDLARDSRCLMGFQQVTPSRMHQAPKPAIRRSLERRRNLQESGPRSLQDSRSKSLESLRSNLRTSTSIKTSSTNLSNFQSDKSASNSDLVAAGISSEREMNRSPERGNAGTFDTDSDEDTEIEEVAEYIDNETGPKQCESRPPEARIRDDKPEQGPGDKSDHVDQKKDQPETTKVAKMSWIPVFGETEIKTVRPKANTNRKLKVMNTSNQPQKSSLRGSVPSQQSSKQSDASLPRGTPNNAFSQQGPQSSGQKFQSNNIVLNEATKRLRFAQDLLEQEKRDSRSANQLVINRATIPTTTVSSPKPIRQQMTRQNSALTSGSGCQKVLSSKPSSSTITNGQTTTPKSTTSTANLANGYVQRLEQMVSEQQKLLDNLVNQLKEQQRGSPITVQCSSPCCHQQGRLTQSPTNKISKPQTSGAGTSRSSVIHHLKDRLNKTKARLTKMLEEERARHQQLKQKVDSSLRKQSDLQNENQILKQSLNKCIDTCLKDISNTFESLGDSLADSIVSWSKQPQTEDEVSSIEGGASGGNLTSLRNVAQLIAENRHLKKMKSHIETIENQRREIFDELKGEKQKVGRLESQLKQSQSELDRLAEVRKQLQSQLEMSIREQENLIKMQSTNTGISSTNQQNDQHQSTSAQATQNEKITATDTDTSSQDQLSSATKIDSSDSIALYTRFIKSMTPDLDSIMRERKQMLSELDTTRATIEKMISEMAN